MEGIINGMRRTIRTFDSNGPKRGMVVTWAGSRTQLKNTSTGAARMTILCSIKLSDG